MKVELRKGRPRVIKWAKLDKAIDDLTSGNHIKITPQRGEKIRTLQASVARRYDGVTTKVHNSTLYITTKETV